MRPVDDIKKSEIDNKYQSHSGLDFADLMVAEILKNKRPEEKEHLLMCQKKSDNDKTPQTTMDETKIAIANSYSIMNTFLQKNLKEKEDKNDRSK